MSVSDGVKCSGCKKISCGCGGCLTDPDTRSFNHPKERSSEVLTSFFEGLFRKGADQGSESSDCFEGDVPESERDDLEVGLQPPVDEFDSLTAQLTQVMRDVSVLLSHVPQAGVNLLKGHFEVLDLLRADRSRDNVALGHEAVDQAELSKHPGGQI